MTDVHEMTVARIPECRRKLDDIADRRAAIGHVLAEAKETLRNALAQRDAAAADLATGAATAPDAKKLAGAIRDAEGKVALAENADRILEGEYVRASAMLAQGRRLEANEEKKRLRAVAKAAAVKLDEAARAYNEAFDNWKEAHLAARDAAGSVLLTKPLGLIAVAGLHVDVKKAAEGYSCSIPHSLVAVHEDTWG